MKSSQNKNHQKIFNILKTTYPSLETELHYQNLFQLLVAVVLSAQCTDKRVNIITPDLFNRFPDAYSMAQANINDIIDIIRSCGLYQAKAKNLKKTANMLIEDFQGSIPKSREELMRLPGVGRKTANVILVVGHKIPAFPVDTHVTRLSRRLGWTKATEPLQIEKDVTKLFKEDNWHDLHHCLILHGRNICLARNPKCSECPVKEYCPKNL